MKEKNLPTTREGLLQRTRELFAHPEAKPENVLTRVQEVVNDGVSQVEDKLLRIWEIMSGYGSEKYQHGKREANVQVEKGNARVKGSTEL